MSRADIAHLHAELKFPSRLDLEVKVGRRPLRARRTCEPTA
jgi:hypothetical protein